MRILGLDVGDRTIGVAISDPLGFTAQGITTIRRKKEEQDIEKILEFCNEYQVETIISGLPKNMNGTIGEQAEKVQKFCAALSEHTDIEIKFWDERLTTMAADMSRKKRKGLVDKIAATYILQGYLDSLSK